MYAPKKSFFFDFDKMIPRLAKRWGAVLSQALGANMHRCRGVVGVRG